MRFLREVTEGFGSPHAPDGGWNVGHLANLGVLLSTDGFSARFDLFNLNLIFDAVEDNEAVEVRDHTGRIVEIDVTDAGIVLTPRDDIQYPYGLLLDVGTLKEMGIEQYEEDDGEPEGIDQSDPTLDFDPLSDDDTMEPPGDAAEYDGLTEGIKRAYRRSGKKIKRGYRVTSGFRKGRVVSSAKAAFKPRAKASTRMKLKIASRRKKVIRVLKGKRTRRKPSSMRLVRMNKIAKV